MRRGGRVSVRASSTSADNIFQKSTDLKPTLSTMISKHHFIVESTLLATAIMLPFRRIGPPIDGSVSEDVGTDVSSL